MSPCAKPLSVPGFSAFPHCFSLRLEGELSTLCPPFSLKLELFTVVHTLLPTQGGDYSHRCTHLSQPRRRLFSPLCTFLTHPGRRLFSPLYNLPHTQGGDYSHRCTLSSYPGRRLFSPLYTFRYTQGGDYSHRCTLRVYPGRLEEALRTHSGRLEEAPRTPRGGYLPTLVYPTMVPFLVYMPP